MAKLQAMLSGHRSIFHALRQSPRWVLAVAMLAMSLQALAASGLWPANGQTPSAGFHTEICSPSGLISQADNSSPDSSTSHAGNHECCSACAFNAPLLGAALPDAVPPAPTIRHAAKTDVAAIATVALYLVPPSRAPPQA